MGCCGSLFRFLLGLINILFLLIGIALVVTTSVLKWSNISKLKEIKGLETVLDLTSIDAVTIALICIGGFIIFLSFIGLVGVCCSNRCFLIMYEIITLILFIAHVGALIALLVMTPKIEQQYRATLNSTIAAINAQPTDENKCKLMLSLSNFFECCGANSPTELTSKICCKVPTPTQGCADASVDWIKKYSTYLLIIPTAVILFVELVSIVGVPFMIGRISKEMKN
jgi:hypothetical protein